MDDLGSSHPQWLLSAYGPGRDAPIQLFGGEREQSFEEMRLYHYQESAQGRQQEAMRKQDNLMNQASQQMQTALRDPEGAMKYVVEGAHQKPNRLDICAHTPLNAPGPLGKQGGFGQPSAPAAGGANFGQPANAPFGQPTQPAQQLNAFGQPSRFQSANAPFSQPAQQLNAFGQPSMLAGNRFGGGGFGAPVQNAAGAFGQPSQLAGTPFGQQAQAQNNMPAFGQPAFGQPALGQPQNNMSSFGQPAFGQPTFAQPQNNTTGFGAPAFGQPSQTAPFSAFPPAAAGNVPPPAIANPMEQSSTSPEVRSTEANNRAARGPSPWTAPQLGSSDIMGVESYSTRDPATNKLRTWKGKPVEYVDDEPFFRRDEIDDGELEKIWFPDGPPPVNKDTELPIEMYDEKTKEAYLYLKEHGVFKDGWIPELPPRSEWIRWDI
ncbi:MAG: hypothetical protein M1816_004252 [Peltula sp. TS41687]|nr:MAG: hypothetical protein M1816_004252 [Peltula sp. TS41687]